MDVRCGESQRNIPQMLLFVVGMPNSIQSTCYLISHGCQRIMVQIPGKPTSSSHFSISGKDSLSELVLRLFLRRVFLDPAALPRPLSIGDLDRSTLLCQNPIGICDVSAALLSTHTPKYECSSCCVRAGHLATKSPNTSSGASTEMGLSHVQSGLQAKISANFGLSKNVSLCPLVLSSEYHSRLPFPSVLRSPPSSLIFTFLYHLAPSLLCTYACRVYSTPRSPELPTSTPLVFRSPCATPSNCQYASRSLRWPASKILLRLLNCQPLVNQARILFILYGPIHRGRIMWHTMCENTAADSEQLSACFGELGSVLQNMLEAGAWSPDEALSILNEITVIPDEWLAENVACLLYTAAGQTVTQLQTYLNVAIPNFATCLFAFRFSPLIKVKIRATLSDLVGLVGEACRATERMDRHVFLDQLARAFQDVIVDLYETDELEDRMEDFSTVLRAQAEFMRALMARIYEE
ncbi:hypothetical protein AHF37_06393 [Paragonimus kellicotti]|nr:hypothetical protein AHF37_06393 [Paragonimus kellicotti]